MSPAVELVCTGTELLNGRSVNTHARLIARRLAPIGLALLRETMVPDDPPAIADSVREALARSDVVLVSGGLGPTLDDCTREAVAGLFGRGLREDEETVERLRTRYAAYGRALDGSRRRQALVVEGAQVLPNPAGAAPGERIDTERGALFLLPGPPGEVAAVLDAHVLPWLTARFPGAAIEERILMVAGIGESDIADCIDAAGLPWDGLTLAYCASPGRVEVRLTAAPGAGARLTAQADALAERLGKAVYARERADLEDVVAELLAGRGLTLAVAESCTGGMLAARLTDAPGSSRFFRGGCVAYANEVKVRRLAVSPETLAQFGAVSGETAVAMAVGVRAAFEADLGVSVTGIAGPDGGTPEKPVGTVCIGVADDRGTASGTFRFGRDRTLNREWSVQRALDVLRLRLAHTRVGGKEITA